jgi:hypothetical protein
MLRKETSCERLFLRVMYKQYIVLCWRLRLNLLLAASELLGNCIFKMCLEPIVANKNSTARAATGYFLCSRATIRIGFPELYICT